MSVFWFLLVFLILSGAVLFQKNNHGEVHIEISTMIKGITAMLIVFGHCINSLQMETVKMLNVGWYCVAVFFFLSGYGVTYGYVHKKDYLQKFWKIRLVKVLLPFFVSHITYFIIKQFCGVSFSLKDVLLGIAGQCTIVDNSWYPISIIIFYVIFFIVFKMRYNDKKKALFLFVGVLAITFLEWIILGNAKDYWFISNLSFVLGVCIFLWDRRLDKWKHYVILGGIGYLLSMASVPVCHYVWGTYKYYVYILSCNLMSAFIVLLMIALVGKFGKKQRDF